LSGQPRGAFACLLDLVEIGEQIWSVFDAIAQQFAVPQNRREQIVEIVRDAPRELTDGLHLLRLAELFLETQPVPPRFDIPELAL